jgi:salicylate hydroxylase
MHGSLTCTQHFITYPVEKRQVCNVGVFVSDRSRPADERVWNGPWVQPVDTQAMLDDFAGWDERALNVLKVGRPPRPLACVRSPVSAAYQGAEALGAARGAAARPLDARPHHAARRLGTFPIFILRDRRLTSAQAHASLPHNGAGAGQAIEDAYVLGELLRLPACTKETIPAFLQAYEAVRRPRASRQQEHARESGEVRRALRGRADLTRVRCYLRSLSLRAPWAVTGRRSPVICRTASTGSGRTTSRRMLGRPRSS